MDTLGKLKSELFAELTIQYKNLVNSLRAMPIDQTFKNPGFQNLDQGIMWFEKGIHLIQVQTAVPEKDVESIKKDEPVLDGLTEEKPETLQ